uniref:Uncharacterized protein n=1 Tax=Oryza punctata TaxID=4537 RepID=A0A0E0LDX2_ORYPU
MVAVHFFPCDFFLGDITLGTNVPATNGTTPGSQLHRCKHYANSIAALAKLAADILRMKIHTQKNLTTQILPITLVTAVS